MTTQQQNRNKLKRLAASAGQQGSDSGAVALGETCSEAPSTQPSPAAPMPLGKIAHDFNNILTLVLGYGEHLMSILPEDHPGRSYAVEICRAAREGERLSLELASAAKRDPTEAGNSPRG
ncbi:MAG TPA: hypothetical protein VHX49_01625 [Candidatus Acidoferrales bacterium]|jgi:hypothetical protein|nr:hypothetical protein [Candidatus Acidoferrales bacterium]